MKYAVGGAIIDSEERHQGFEQRLTADTTIIYCPCGSQIEWGSYEAHERHVKPWKVEHRPHLNAKTSSPNKPPTDE